MKSIVKIISIVCVTLLVSCSGDISLQEYFVAQQEDSDFIAVDIPSSLLDLKKDDLPEKEKAALESLKKVNLLALPIKGNEAKFETEKAKINSILKSEKYQTLMRYGSNGRNVVLNYLGEEDAVDEVVVFATDVEMGLVIARMLGNNMKPEHMVSLVKAVEKNEVDLSVFEGFAKAFGEKTKS